ncbi:MAG: hypothetical protein WAO98_04805 [Alphaproteobacteria bacterium]
MVPIISIAEAYELEAGSDLLHPMVLDRYNPEWDHRHLISFGISPRASQRLLEHPQYEVRDFSHAIVTFVDPLDGAAAYAHASKHPIITDKTPEDKKQHLLETYAHEVIDTTRLALQKGLGRIRNGEIWKSVPGQIRTEDNELSEIRLTYAVTPGQYAAAMAEHQRWCEGKPYRITGIGGPNCESYAMAIARAAKVKLPALFPWPNIVGRDIELEAYVDDVRLKAGKGLRKCNAFRQASSRLTTSFMAQRAKKMAIPGSQRLIILDRPVPRYLQKSFGLQSSMLEAV